jgi:hypothetical protein
MAIINNSYQFIFIHVPKAAGTTVTSVLSRFTNYCDLEIGGTDFGEKIQPAYKIRFGLAKHSTAAEVRSIVGTVLWSKYCTFSFVRNPFARCLSTYHFLRTWKGLNDQFSEKMKSFENFNDYVLSDVWEESPGPDNIFRPQLYWLRSAPNSNQLLVDFVGRVERINEDLMKLMEIIGIQKDTVQQSGVPQLNRSQQSDPTQISHAGVVEKIVKKYKADFDAFGYSLDPSHVLQPPSGESNW